jgi:hypothetical protein
VPVQCPAYENFESTTSSLPDFRPYSLQSQTTVSPNPRGSPNRSTLPLATVRRGNFFAVSSFVTLKRRRFDSVLSYHSESKTKPNCLHCRRKTIYRGLLDFTLRLNHRLHTAHLPFTPPYAQPLLTSTFLHNFVLENTPSKKMSPRTRKDNASGMKIMNRRRLEEKRIASSALKKRLGRGGKISKLYRKSQSKLKSPHSIKQLQDELTSDAPDDADGEVEGRAVSSDESEDDELEPRAFAPSGVTRASKFSPSGGSRLALKRSSSNSDTKHQAGRIGRKDHKRLRFSDQLSEVPQAEDILEFADFQEFHFDLFSHNGFDAAVETDVVDKEKTEESDEDVYKKLETIDDSDLEDDDKIESQEEAAIIQELEESMMFVNGDSIFPTIEDSTQGREFLIHSHEFWESAREASRVETNEKLGLALPTSTGTEASGTTAYDPASSFSHIYDSSNGVVECFPMSEPENTGMITPSSIRRSLSLKCMRKFFLSCFDANR